MNGDNGDTVAQANLVAALGDRLRFGPEDAALWLTTFAFDIALLELFLPLCTGGRVVVAEDELRTDPARLLDRVLSGGVTLVPAPPTLWRTVVGKLVVGKLGDQLAPAVPPKRPYGRPSQ